MLTPCERELKSIREIFSSRVLPDDVTVRTIKLPPTVHGFVLVDEEGHNNVYLNSRDPYPVRIRALEHEIEHIAHGDVFSSSPIEDIEHI